MTTDGAIVPQEPRQGGIIGGSMSVGEVRAQVLVVQQLMKEVMKDGEHYGTIPGCGPKKTLLKPGAEKLCLLFRMDPQYDHQDAYDGQHLTINSKCTLYHIPTGQRLASGEGSCSTKEGKYAFREQSRVCPACGQPTIIKGKEEYGGGWLCFKKKGGCGQKWQDGAPEIEGQAVGKVPNENVADQYNTVLKMANKRSLVAAVLNATATSDIFTQDIEDFTDSAPAGAPSVSPPQEEPETRPDGRPEGTSKVVILALAAKPIEGGGTRYGIKMKGESGVERWANTINQKHYALAEMCKKERAYAYVLVEHNDPAKSWDLKSIEAGEAIK